MDMLTHAADRCIRRALGFAGLAIGTVMLSLSFDIVLALRSGGDMLALTALVLLIIAWRAGDTNPRDSETWALFRAMQPDATARIAKPEAKRMLSTALRRRLLWHAERVGLGALAIWALMGLTMLMSALFASPGF